MAAKTIYILLFLVIFGCYKNNTKAIDTYIECDLSEEVLKKNYIVKFYDQNQPLSRDSFTISKSLPVSNRGCVSVEKNKNVNFSIQAFDNKGARVESSNLHEGINKINLVTFLGEFDVWAYCGDSIKNGEMFLKFNSFHNSNSKMIFIDKYENEHILELNSAKCAKVPMSHGMIEINGELFAHVQHEQKVNFVGKEQIGSGNFLSVCKQAGESDPIVKTFSEEYHEKDCYKLFDLIKKEKNFPNILIGRKIKSLESLNGLEAIESLNLRGNQIVSLYGLRNLRNLKSLSLQNNKIMFLKHLPKNIKHIAIDWNPIYSLKSLDGLNLETIKMNNLPLESSEGLSSQKESLIAVHVEDSIALKDCSDFTKLSNLQILKAKAGKCIGRLFENNLITNTLTFFSAESSGISNGENFGNYRLLNQLTLSFNDIFDVSGISTLDNLRLLDLSFNTRIRNIDELSNMQNLVSIYLHGVGLTNIDFITNMIGLRYIYITENEIKNMSPLLDFSHDVLMRFTSNPIENCPENTPNPTINYQCRMINSRRNR